MMSFNYTTLCFILYLARYSPVFSVCERKKETTLLQLAQATSPWTESTCIALKLAISSCASLEESKIWDGARGG